MLRAWKIGLVAAMIWMAGCRTSQMPVEQTYPVRGTILVSGEPMRGGRVTLTPVDVTRYGPAEATADVQPDGTFVPSAVGGASGLMPGRWKIVVSATGYRDGRPYRSATTIPVRYTRAETSNLEIDVAEGENLPVVRISP